MVTNPFGWLALSEHGGVHGGVLAAAMGECLRAGFGSELEALVGPRVTEGSLLQPGGGLDLLLKRDGQIVAAVAVPVANAVANRLLDERVQALGAACTQRTVLTLFPPLSLDRTRLWRAALLDAILPAVDIAGEVSPHADFFRLYGLWLRGLLSAREAVLAASDDARGLRPVLEEAGLRPLFEHRFAAEVLDAAMEQLAARGWPGVDPRYAAAGREPSSKCLAPHVEIREGRRVVAGVTIVDPYSQHAYGVRLDQGLIAVFAERYDPAQTGVKRSLVWGRRNEFLAQLCELLETDAGALIGASTSESRAIAIGSGDLWLAADREAMVRTLADCASLLWVRADRGRVRVDSGPYLPR
jgi:hypothetical protein